MTISLVVFLKKFVFLFYKNMILCFLQTFKSKYFRGIYNNEAHGLWTQLGVKFMFCPLCSICDSVSSSVKGEWESFSGLWEMTMSQVPRIVPGLWQAISSYYDYDCYFFNDIIICLVKGQMTFFLCIKLLPLDMRSNMLFCFGFITSVIKVK